MGSIRWLGLVFILVSFLVCGASCFPPPQAALLTGGANHVCYLGSDQNVKCFGDNSVNELAPAELDFSHSRVLQIAASGTKTCIHDNWAVTCCDGGGCEEQGEFTPKNVPWLVLSRSHVCGIQGFDLNCWDNPNQDENDARIALVKNPRSLAAGEEHECVIDDDGVRCFGSDISGQTEVPKGLVDPAQVVAGVAHTCVLEKSGVVCWGDDHFGQTDVPTDLKRPDLLASGGFHTCAIAGGKVRCWGANFAGQTHFPSDLKGVEAVVAGNAYTCALNHAGLQCWGSLTNTVPRNQMGF